MNYSVIWKEKLEDMGATVKNRKVVQKSSRRKSPTGYLYEKNKFVVEFRVIDPEKLPCLKILRILNLSLCALFRPPSGRHSDCRNL